MSEADSMHDDDEFVDFLKELEGGGDRGEILRRYCSAYPDLADDFRALGATRQLLGLGLAEVAIEPRLPGTLGDFRIKREIARGGMGTIYEAEQGPFGRRVALKTIRRDRHLSPSARERFLREQSVLARLHHTHIVPIHAGGQDGELQYFAMPYIEGAALQHVVRSAYLHEATSPGSDTPSLAELAQEAAVAAGRPAGAGDTTETTPPRAEPAATTDGKRAPESSGFVLSSKYLRSVARVIADAADALHHAHQAGVVHRDVKPSNIMVDSHEHCWVLDFGLAAYQAQENGTARPEIGPEAEARVTSGVLGTPRYMAPEQFHEQADERTDIWGLGVTLYELLTLRPPFASREQIESTEPLSPRQIVVNLPRDLQAICTRALHKNPQHRYPTAKAFGDDLRRWLAHEPVQARPSHPIRRLALWSRRNKPWAAAIAASFASLIAVAVGGIVVGQVRAESLRAVTKSAKAEAQAALAREKAERRAGLIQNLIRVRLTAHNEGWSALSWDLIRDAARLDIGDDLQGQATASLAGLDVRTIKRFRSFGGYSLAFDPRGGQLLMATTSPSQPFRADGVRLWDSATDRLEVLAEKGEGPIAFRPDGTPVQLATVVKEGGGRTLEWLELAGNRASRSLEIPGRLDESETSQPSLSVDGSLAAAPVVSAEGKRALAVWDTATGKPRHQLDGPSTAAAFSPDGSLLARGDSDGRITVWSLSRGEPIASLHSGRNAILALAFARDHRRLDGPEREGAGAGWLLASGDSGAGVVVWDVGSGIPRAFCHGSHHEVTALAFSPDGQTLASAGRSVRLWDLATGRPLLSLNATDFIQGLTFSPDGKRLAAAGIGVFSGPDVSVWTIEPDRGVQTLRGLGGEVSSLAYSPGGRLVAALSHDWRVAVWDRETGFLRHVFDAPRGVAGNGVLAFDGEDRRLAIAASGRAVLWDLETGRPIRTWELPPSLAEALAFHPSGRLLLGRLETKDRLLGPFLGAHPREHPRVYRVRDLLGPDPVERPLRELGEFNWHAFASFAPPDGRYFVVDGSGGPQGLRRTVKVFDPLTGKTLFECSPEAPSNYSCIQIDPSGQLLQLGEGRTSPTRVSLLEMPSGRFIRASEGGDSSLGPGARSWAKGREPSSGEAGHGYALFETGGRHLVDLGIDAPAGVPTFQADGHRFAWGTTEGVVHIADLIEVQRRLAAVGLGW